MAHSVNYAAADGSICMESLNKSIGNGKGVFVSHMTNMKSDNKTGESQR